MQILPLSSSVKCTKKKKRGGEKRDKKWDPTVEKNWRKKDWIKNIKKLKENQNNYEKNEKMKKRGKLQSCEISVATEKKTVA